jgi:hypothetical protein
MFGGGAMTVRLGRRGGGGAALTVGGRGFAFGCAATANPLALIKTGRATATGTRRTGGALIFA